MFFKKSFINVQFPPLYWITLSQVESDNINRLIQLTNVCFNLNQKKIDTSQNLSRSRIKRTQI